MKDIFGTGHFVRLSSFRGDFLFRVCKHEYVRLNYPGARSKCMSFTVEPHALIRIDGDQHLFKYVKVSD